MHLTYCLYKKGINAIAKECTASLGKVGRRRQEHKSAATEKAHVHKTIVNTG